MISEAAAATQASQPPGLFLLVWGVGATAVGLLTATNFRGLADNFARRAEASSAGRRRRPLWQEQRPLDPARRVRQLRLIAIPFMIIGPIVTVVGIISISHGRITDSGLGALPGPFRFAFIAFAVAVAGSSWLPRHGLYRPAARRGGWRLAAALLSSLCVLIFGIGTAIGQMTIAIVAFAIGGLASLILVAEDKP